MDRTILMGLLNSDLPNSELVGSCKIGKYRYWHLYTAHAFGLIGNCSMWLMVAWSCRPETRTLRVRRNSLRKSLLSNWPTAASGPSECVLYAS